MPTQVFIAHAEEEEAEAAKLAGPIGEAGYDVKYYGSIDVGDSLTEAANRVLALEGPVVLCGTIAAIGTGWAYTVVNAARASGRGVRVFPVRMQAKARIEILSLDAKVAEYWRDPEGAVREVVGALTRYYPLGQQEAPVDLTTEDRYRELALNTCDIVDLAGMPEDQVIAGRAPELALRRLYVPLRVRVEPPVEQETADTRFNDLEARRLKRAEAAKEPGVAVGSRLGRSSRLVILGDPGAGKTTLLRWLATAYLLRLKSAPEWKDLPDVETLPDEDWLPVIIRCRDLDATVLGGSLEDILRHTLRKAQLSDEQAAALRKLLMHRIGDGSALLLIDGLDEITDVPSRVKFCRDIEQIAVAYPATPIVVTSRIVGYREIGLRIGRGFEHLTVAELTREGKDDFVRRWCELTEPLERRETAISELQHDIHATDRIEHLTGNPMLLTTMALVKRRVGQLPSRRVDLYRYAVDVLLTWRPDQQQRLEAREALPQLQYVAHAMCQRGVQQLREDEVLELLAQMRTEYPSLPAVQSRRPDELLRAVERQSGIIVETGRVRHAGSEVPVFEFRHLTFQEYLAAMALLSGKYPGTDHSHSFAQRVVTFATNVALGEAVLEYLVAEAWREPLRLSIAGSEDSVDEAILALSDPQVVEETSGRPQIVLAAACLADSPNVSARVADEVLRRFAAVVNRYDGGTNSSATLAAREIATTARRDSLLRVLAREFLRRDPFERRGMSDLLAELMETAYSDDERTALLLEAASDDVVTAVMGAFAVSEVEARAPLPAAAIARLTELISHGGALAEAAAYSFQRTENVPDAIIAVAWTAIADVSFDASATEYLTGVVRGKPSHEITLRLLARLAVASEPELKIAMLNAIGRDDDAASFLPRPLPYLHDADIEVRDTAAWFAGRFRLVSEVPRLIQLAREERMDAALQALGEIATIEATNAMVDMLHDAALRNEFGAYAVGYALAIVGSDEARHILHEAFRSRGTPNSLVRGVMNGLFGDAVDGIAIDYRQPITEAILGRVERYANIPIAELRRILTRLAEYLPIQLDFSP